MPILHDSSEAWGSGPALGVLASWKCGNRFVNQAVFILHKMGPRHHHISPGRQEDNPAPCAARLHTQEHLISLS